MMKIGSLPKTLETFLSFLVVIIIYLRIWLYFTFSKEYNETREREKKTGIITKEKINPIRNLFFPSSIFLFLTKNDQLCFRTYYLYI